MDINELKFHVDNGLSSYQIAEAVELSPSTVKYWLKKYGLSTAKKKDHLCLECLDTNPDHFYGHQKSQCKKCFNKGVTERGKSIKAQLVMESGGKCILCGYDKYIGALEFHHIDPSIKDKFAHNIREWSIERARTEIEKCVLVCSNCHREIEAGIVTLS